MSGSSCGLDDYRSACVEITTITKGWSAKKQILGKPVYNEQNE